jgi:hypothetical protein
MRLWVQYVILGEESSLYNSKQLKAIEVFAIYCLGEYDGQKGTPTDSYSIY